MSINPLFTFTGIRAIVTDIEGTVSPVNFVKQILFPYARERLAEWLSARQHQPAVQRLLEDIGHEAPEGDTLAGAIAVLQQWSDADQKITPLKTLQGWIWADGYASGELVAPLYADVLPALNRWQQAEIGLSVYSSGSVEAQQLFFGHSNEGDIRPYFQRWFDTRIGGKLQADSYYAIARQLDLPARQLLFLSDHVGEVTAARQAGWQVAHVVREEGAAGGTDGGHLAVIAQFAELNVTG